MAVETVSGYELVRSLPVARLGGTYHELLHTRTGARHVHIECADDNNVFGVIFMTVPHDSTGIAHILEHSVLAGSKRFPVRTPFFSMTTRSLNTFMNASTSPAWTVYPFSTRNPKDYRNLLDIYLDATFHPLLEEDTFKQEGHRLEYERPEDPSSGLRYKGVVFNEMKASWGSSGTAMYRGVAEALFPGLTYENHSGGQPDRILDLTWQQLKDFHVSHYQPANARFFTYGDQDLAATLEVIDEQVLSRVEPRTVDVSIPLVTRFTEPRRQTVRYALAAGDDARKNGQALVAWVTEPTFDHQATMAMRVLSEVLLGNAASPLRHALIASGLGSALADTTGLSTYSKEAVFAAGLKGIDPATAPKVEQLVLETLARIAEQGVDLGQVDAALHHIELSEREHSNAGLPFGLKVLGRLTGAYVYGGDPAEALELETAIEELRLESRNGLFERMIRDLLVDNPHRITLTGEADAGLEAERRGAEEARLAALEAALSPADRQAIVDDGVRLQSRQQAPIDTALLPNLELSDITVRVLRVERQDQMIAGVEIESYPQTTGGVSYAAVLADAAGLPVDLERHLGLHTSLLTRVGAGDLDHLGMAARIAAATGGVGAGVHAMSRIGGGLRLLLEIGGRALAEDQAELAAIMTDLLARPRFETSRLDELVREQSANLKTGLSGAAMQYAQISAAARLSPQYAFSERVQGIAHRRLVLEYAARGAAGLSELAARLEDLSSRVHTAARLHIGLTARPEDLAAFTEDLGRLARALPAGAPAPAASQAPLQTELRRAFTAPLPVATNIMALPSVPYDHPDAPVFPVLARYLWATTLHREIREKGGAYVSSAVADTGNGLFMLMSARDPNIARSYEVWRSLPTRVLDGPIDAEKLVEGILSACRALDPLESPDTRGRRAFNDRLAGITPEMREQFWRRTLEVSAEDLRRVTETHLKPDQAACVTIAAPAAVEAANQDGFFGAVEPIDPPA